MFGWLPWGKSPKSDQSPTQLRTQLANKRERVDWIVEPFSALPNHSFDGHVTPRTRAGARAPTAHTHAHQIDGTACTRIHTGARAPGPSRTLTRVRNSGGARACSSVHFGPQCYFPRVMLKPGEDVKTSTPDHTTTGVQDWADTCTESKEFTCAGEKFSFTLLPGGFQKVGFCQFFTISELIGFNWPCKFRWSYPSEFCVPNRIWPIQPHAYTYACRARNMWGSSFNTAVLRRSCEHRLPYPS